MLHHHQNTEVVQWGTEQEVVVQWDTEQGVVHWGTEQGVVVQCVHACTVFVFFIVSALIINF